MLCNIGHLGMVDKVVFCIAGIVLSLVFVPLYVNESFGGIVGPPPLVGDFGCRFIDPSPPPLELVRLTDQFGTDDYVLESPDVLCSFGNKTGVIPPGPPDSVLPLIPDQHYKVYPLVPTSPLFITVELTDQFGTDSHGILSPHELWVPASKTHDPDFFPAITDIHWLCYDLDFGVIPPVAAFNFTDQFEFATVSPDAPFQMCNPVEKQVEDAPFTGMFTGPVFGDASVPDHLKCYDVIGPAFSTFPIILDDQFGPGSPIAVFGLDSVCLVADKVVLGGPPVIGGTSIPLDTVSLFLAGASINMFWIIPVVGAGVGIAIFTLKRNH